VIAEELGFVGVLAVVALFALLVQRAFAIGRQASSSSALPGAGRQGIGIWIGVQSFINMGVNMGLLPTKGLTLPLMSFGGSGIVANCVALAILLRIDWEKSPAHARGASMKTLMVMAGGTGGHIFPAHRRRRGHIFPLRDARGLARRLDGQPGWHGSAHRAAARLRDGLGALRRAARQGLLRKLLLPLNLLRGFWQALARDPPVKPDVVLGMGGYITFPGGMMAALLGVPLVLHEQNSVAGLANRVLAAWPTGR
jgi:hypothetical protein